MRVSRRIKGITASLTLEIASLAKVMQTQGRQIINFAAGEPDFDTPAYIKQAAWRAIKKGFTKYTPATGHPKLKQAICKKFAQDNQLAYTPAQIIVACGAKHALYNIFQVLCQKGDEVIMASPFWVSYPQMVKLAEARPRIINTQAGHNFKFEPRSLKQNINKNTKAIILNSPGNPTGAVYSRGQLKQIAKIALKHNLYVISDEIYEKLLFDGRVHTSIASLNKRIFKQTIVINGVSKAYAMTGWRIGYLASANAEIIKAIDTLQSHSTSNPCSISQWAAWEALNKSTGSQMKALSAKFQLRRDCMIAKLDKIEQLSYAKPSGAFYIFCNISKTGLGSFTFAQRLLKEAEVAVIPGVAFGRDDYIRLSFTTSLSQIRTGMQRLKDWLEHRKENA